MNPSDKAILILRRRIAWRLLLKYVLAFVTAWLFAWGTAVLVLRLTAGTSPLVLLWGLVPVLLLAGLAALPALRRLPPSGTLRALLDRAGGCGGLLMAAAEQDLGRWRRMLPAADALRVRWHGGRAWSLFATGVVFLATGLLFPESLSVPGMSRPLEIGNEVKRLAGQLEALKEAGALEPERAAALQEKLAQLKKQARGEDPAKTLEALDHLHNVVTEAAKAAAEKALNKSENLNKADALAEGLDRAGEKLDLKIKAEAMAELADLAKKAAGPDGKLAEEALKEMAGGKLSSEAMKKLSADLRGGKNDLAKKLGKLADARLIDPELLAKCASAGTCDAEALADMLGKAAGGKSSVAEMLRQSEGGRPGRGGVSEGPGAAALTWGEKTSEAGVTFKEEALPPAAVKALKDSQLVGLGKEAPTAEKAGGPSEPGALGPAAAGGGSANTPVVLPRHRAAVERYFERPPRK
jgi:hypothetical protein